MGGPGGEETELWPKPDSQCTLQDFPLVVYYPVGFWTAQGPVVCGGYNTNTNQWNRKCFIYKHRQWMPWTNMTTLRGHASAIQIGQNQALIIGGKDRLNTTELVSSNGSEEGNEFPEIISRHCSFTINATHALVTGGVQNGHWGDDTWYVDLTTQKFTPGPTMKTPRSSHGCSTVQLGNRSFGIVAGGQKSGGTTTTEYGLDWSETRHRNTGYLYTTEMIDLDQESPEWFRGMQDQSKIVDLVLKSTFS